MASKAVGSLIYTFQFAGKTLHSLWSGRGPGWRLSRIALLVVVGLVGLAVMFEDHFIYYPSKYPEGRWDLAGRSAQKGKGFPQIEDRIVTTSDGVRIHGWLCSASDSGGHGGQASSLSSPLLREALTKRAEPMILFLHGNAGNVTDRYELIGALTEIPAHVFIIDYRGYGKSDGSPSEQGLYKDAQAAWEFLTGELGIAPSEIVIYGESLGGAAAVDLATKESPGGLILQSSFTSMPDMVSHIAPVFPRFLLHTRMDSIGRIDKIGCPKLFVHGTIDELVPLEMGKRLYAASPGPKELYEVQGAGHNDVFQAGGKAYLDTVRAFVHRSCCQ